MTDDADLDALRTATNGLVDAVTSIEDGHWVLPTPCEAWSLRDLVDHVVGGNWYTVRVLSGQQSDDALAATMAMFEGDPVSADATVDSARDQLKAFGTEGSLERSWSHVSGELPGREMLRLRLHDLIVHTWDIDQTHRPPASVPRSLADWGLNELAGPGSLMSKHFDIPAAPGARPAVTDPALAYLQAFGRDR